MNIAFIDFGSFCPINIGVHYRKNDHSGPRHFFCGTAPNKFNGCIEKNRDNFRLHHLSLRKFRLLDNFPREVPGSKNVCRKHFNLFHLLSRLYTNSGSRNPNLKSVLLRKIWKSNYMISVPTFALAAFI